GQDRLQLADDMAEDLSPFPLAVALGPVAFEQLPVQIRHANAFESMGLLARVGPIGRRLRDHDLAGGVGIRAGSGPAPPRAAGPSGRSRRSSGRASQAGRRGGHWAVKTVSPWIGSDSRWPTARSHASRSNVVGSDPGRRLWSRR